MDNIYFELTEEFNRGELAAALHYLERFRAEGLSSLDLRAAHSRAVELATSLLPTDLLKEDGDGDAERG